MTSFSIKIEPEAIKDIQEGIDWYNKQKSGLGQKFLSEIQTAINQLKTHPFFQVRYDDVRCLPLKTYPYMLHFTVHEDDNEVIIRAVFNTSRDPDLWEDRTQ